MSRMDEIFRKQLQHRSEPTPSHLWEGIERQLDGPAAKRRAPLYWLSAGVAGVLLVILMTSIVSRQGASTVALDKTRQQAQQEGVALTDHAEADNQEVYRTVDSALEPSSSMAREQKPVTRDAESAATISLASDEDAKRVSAGTSQVATAVRAQSLAYAGVATAAGTTTNGAAAQDVKVTDGATTRLVSMSSAVRSDAVQSQSAASDMVPSNSVYQQDGTTQREREVASSIGDGIAGVVAGTTPAKASGQIKWLIERTDNVTVNTISAPEIMKSTVFDRRRELFRTPEEIRSVGIFGLKEADDRIDGLHARAAAMYTECPSFSTDHTGIFVDAYMSHDIPLRTLTAKDASANALVDTRNQTESIQYSYGLGGRVSLRLPSGFSIRTGLHYARIQERLSYMDEGGSDFVVDNNHQMFDLPLLLGYDFGLEGRRLYYSINGGLLLNVTYTQSGTILDSENMPVRVADAAADDRSAYNDTAGLSLYASAAVYYRLLTSMDIYLEPQIRYMPGSLTSDTYALDQRYTTLGVQTGVRFRF